MVHKARTMPALHRRGCVRGICDRLLQSRRSQQAGNPAAADFATALRNRVTTDAMMAHLSKLQDIANANNGTRAVGTPGYEATVDYVVNTLRNNGFDVQTPEFSAHVLSCRQGVGDARWQDRGRQRVEYSLGTGPEGVTRAAGGRARRRQAGLRGLRLRRTAGAGRGGAGGPRQLPVQAERRRSGYPGRGGDDPRRQCR